MATMAKKPASSRKVWEPIASASGMVAGRFFWKAFTRPIELVSSGSTPIPTSSQVPFIRKPITIPTSIVRQITFISHCRLWQMAGMMLWKWKAVTRIGIPQTNSGQLAWLKFSTLTWVPAIPAITTKAAHFTTTSRAMYFMILSTAAREMSEVTAKKPSISQTGCTFRLNSLVMMVVIPVR